jgi:hypothetical protein
MARRATGKLCLPAWYMHTTVIPGLVPGIHLSVCSGNRGALDPGNKCRDDTNYFVGMVAPNSFTSVSALPFSTPAFCNWPR